jgi:putative peptidoglycan lipid II flippase
VTGSKAGPAPEPPPEPPADPASDPAPDVIPVGADTDVVRSSAVMAVGTILSRVTGVFRTVALAAAVGSGVLADAYTTANILPNIIYILLIGGALNAVFIPELVRHMKDDADAGTAYTDRLLTLATIVLGVTTVLAIALAPLIAHLYAPDYTGRSLQVLVDFAYLCLPQIFFYGMYTLYSQVLNARGRFGAPMFAPIANNVVVIAGCVAFVVVVRNPSIDTVSDRAVLLLGGVTTLGIVVQAAILTPVMARVGYRFRPRMDLRGQGLGKAVHLAKWTVFFVLMNQIGLLVITRWANTANYVSASAAVAGGGSMVYNTAYLMFILPHSVVTVSVVTALLPRMSRDVHAGNLRGLRSDLSRGMRLVSTIIVPSSIALILLGPQLAVLLLGYGNMTADGGALIGMTLQAFAVGAVGFSLYYVLLRGFYALEDTRTPALVSIGLNLLNIAVGYAFYRRLPADRVVVGLALSYSIAFTAVMVVFWVILRRRIGGLDSYITVRTLVRLTLAGTVTGLLAWGIRNVVADVSVNWLGAGRVPLLLEVLVVVPCVFVVFACVARFLRVAEVREILSMAEARLPLPGSRRRTTRAG